MPIGYRTPCACAVTQSYEIAVTILLNINSLAFRLLSVQFADLTRCRNTKAMSEQQLDCALDLMRRLPPQKTEENLAGLIDLVRLIFFCCAARFMIDSNHYTTRYRPCAKTYCRPLISR